MPDSTTSAFAFVLPKRAAGRVRSRLRISLLLFLWVALPIWTGCGRAPEVRAPVPESRPGGAAEALELPLAALAAPVVLDLTRILQDLEEAVPRTFGDLEARIEHPENNRVHVAFLASRTPFTAAMQGEVARLSATLEYRMRAWYDPPLLPEVRFSCGTGEGEIPPRAVLELSSPLTIGADWALRSRVQVARIEPASEEERDRCDVTPLGIDITGTVMNAASAFLNGHGAAIDARVAGVDLRSRLQGVWETLLEPHELTDGVWLMVNPVGVTQGGTVGEGTVVTIQVGLTARPRIVVGPRPEVVLGDLPPLEEGEVADEARILMEGYARYDAIGERLTAEFTGQELTLGGNLFRIQALGLRGIGEGKVALEVTFDGAARGRVFLVGTPHLEIGTGMIQVPDLEFDLQTRNLLVGGLAWIARGNLVQLLRERARIPAQEVMELAEAQLLRGINRDLSDEVTVEGEVLGSRLLDAVAGAEGLIVRAEARARAILRIQQADGPPPVSVAAGRIGG